MLMNLFRQVRVHVVSSVVFRYSSHLLVLAMKGTSLRSEGNPGPFSHPRGRTVFMMKFFLSTDVL